jgi:hypothetical protein
VAHIKTLTLGPNDRMISFDAEALYPSVPIKDCITIRCKLDADATLISRTKLTPTDICKLLDLCLSSSNFIIDGRHHTTKDSGPIGLSLMVCISEIWMIHTMEKAITIAHERGVAPPRHLTIYMDHCWGVMRSLASAAVHEHLTLLRNSTTVSMLSIQGSNLPEKRRLRTP